MTTSAARTTARRHTVPPTHLLLVILGGIFGTAARAGLTEAVPELGGWPVATAFVNLAGAFLLGIGLEGLARRGPDVGRRRVLRLMIGTGFMGSFTTYSTFAVEIGTLTHGGDIAMAAVYAVGLVILGIIAAAVGIWVGAGHHRLVRRRAARKRARRATDGSEPADGGETL